MMNVNFTAKMDKFLGSYGPQESGYAFTPIPNQRIIKSKDRAKTTGDVLYRGMIMKYDIERVISYNAYSFLDLLSASGGIISSMLAIAAPVAAIFSDLSWNLGIMRLLFMAKTKSPTDQFDYKHVSFSNWQFLRLYFRLYGP